MIAIIIVVSLVLSIRSLQSQGDIIFPDGNYAIKKLKDDRFTEQFIEKVYESTLTRQELVAFEMVFKNGHPEYYFFSSSAMVISLTDWLSDDATDYTENLGKKSFAATQFLPQYDFLLPIITKSDLVTICDQLTKDDEIWWQIVVYPVDDSWKRRAEKEISKSTFGKIGYKRHVATLLLDVIKQVVSIFTPGPIYQGKIPEPIVAPLSPVEKEELEEINQKLSSHGFIGQIRLAAVAGSLYRSKELVSNLESDISQATSGGVNRLIKRPLMALADEMLDLYGSRSLNIIKGRFGGLSTQASEDSFVITTREIADLMFWSEPNNKDTSLIGEIELAS